MGDLPLGVSQFVEKPETMQVLTRAGFIVNLKKSDLLPTGSGVHRGQIPHRRGQAVHSIGKSSGPDLLSTSFLQGRGVQTSPALSAPARTDGSNLAVSGICVHTSTCVPSSCTSSSGGTM